ncbi:hypothetical protein BZG36_00206 [Bifiguratus adelaidae]|uniref:BED-type domain-containing protein n=1 Tax=Bifiguratus adelaidae TaxID=1938954 RepID=A0A261Y8P6_9FUNG|nr:hypothetical protein BZG36_00206 [Bifiguratus adelaidae]
MGKKKKSKESKPWCWYCEREFDDEKVLLDHQRAKHFKCPFCPRRLTTAGGMVVHAQQVHKERISIVQNAIPGRESALTHEIFGMTGIPEEDLIAHEAARNPNKRPRTDASNSPAQAQWQPQQPQSQSYAQTYAAAPVAYAPPPGLPPPGFPPAFPGQYSQFYQPRPPGPPMPYGASWPSAPGIPPPGVPPPGAPGAIPGQPAHPPFPPFTGTPPPASSPYSPASTPTTALAVPQVHTPESYQPVEASNVSAPPADMQAASVNGIPGSTSDAPVTDLPGSGVSFAIRPVAAAKKKTDNSILVYDDNEISPEEKRAQLEKYRYGGVAAA